MTFLPAIIVLAIVFLSFSKKTLAPPEKTRKKIDHLSGVSDSLVSRELGSDALLKYELLRGMDRKN